MNQGNLEEAKRTFLVCAEIPDENLKDPHTHKSSVTSCLYNLGKLLHEQGQQEVSEGHLLQLRNLPDNNWDAFGHKRGPICSVWGPQIC